MAPCVDPLQEGQHCGHDVQDAGEVLQRPGGHRGREDRAAGGGEEENGPAALQDAAFVSTP